ncbi:MAG: DUF5684 domain-containing protein [Eubacteriales bacterium]|nr:DUF5684 domain-containing protein [Eubacteriales bacterium]
MLKFALSAILGYFVIIAVYYVLCVIGNWKMFEKMSEPGWKSLIPLYSDYTIYKDCWNTSAFWGFLAASVITAVGSQYSDASAAIGMLVSLASMASCVVCILCNIKLSRSFGHGYLFAFGLTFLRPIFLMILGFGESQYYGNTSY